MDEFEWATTAVNLRDSAGEVDESRAEQWFTAVCDAYHDPAAEEPVPDWTMFIGRLYQTAEQARFDNDTVNWFTEGLAERASDPLDVVRVLFEERDTLRDRYARLTAGAGSSAEWGRYTPAQWYEYLTVTMGNGWAGWNGIEAEWDGFKAYFLGYADHCGVAEEAGAFIAQIEAAGNKIAAFAQHGITIESAWAKSTPAQWYQHLTVTLGNGWTGWDGREDSWNFFKQYFMSYADYVGVPTDAQEFLNGIEQNAAGKIAAFNAHGITIIGPDGVPAVPTTEPPPVGTAGGTGRTTTTRGFRDFLQNNRHRWKGTDSSWTFFRGWLLAEARVQGLDAEAQAFLDYADQVSDRTEAFDAYGATAPARPAPGTEDAPEPARGRRGEPAAAQAEATAAVRDLGAAVAARLRQARPDATASPELVGEVLIERIRARRNAASGTAGR